MRIGSVLGCLVPCFVLACSSNEPAPDAGEGDAGELDGGDPRMGLLLPRCEETDPEPETPLPHVPSTLVATLVPAVDRLAMPGPRNPALEIGEQMYRDMGMHVVRPGPPRPRLRRTDLGADSTASSGRRSLAYFVHLSDFQLADDESPTRLARFDSNSMGTPAAMRAHEAYIPLAVSAMNRTIARIERPERAIDFGIVTGDCADSAQRNELAWVIAVMNGGQVHADSGEDDDPVPGPGNDPKDPFEATAFPAPWLYVPGNHDVEVVGVSAPTDDLRAQAIGTRAPGGTRDYRRWYAPVTNGPIPADPNRAILDRDDIVAMLRAAEATGPEGPPGHGYPETGPVETSLGAHYAYDAIPGLLRILAIDTSDRTGGSEGMITRSMLDGWLLLELDRAAADGVLVMLASHHSTTSMDRRSGQFGDEVAEALEPAEIEAFFASRPEVIAWLVGHSHDNRVRAIAGPDASRPGYWEIMTSAIADHPGQGRMIELVDNGDGTLSIFATLVDFDTDSCMERRYRALMTMEWVTGWIGDTSRNPEDLNVELVRAVPASAMAAVEARRAGAPERIESQTTLAGM